MWRRATNVITPTSRTTRCKNRHCPKCSGSASRDWMAARAEDLLPVDNFHVVFTLPAEIAVSLTDQEGGLWAVCFRASARSAPTPIQLLIIKRLGARIGTTSMPGTTWGILPWSIILTSHMIVGRAVGLSERRQPLGSRASRVLSCSAGFIPLVPTLFIEGLLALHCEREITSLWCFMLAIRTEGYLLHIGPAA